MCLLCAKHCRETMMNNTDRRIFQICFHSILTKNSKKVDTCFFVLSFIVFEEFSNEIQQIINHEEKGLHSVSGLMMYMDNCKNCTLEVTQNRNENSSKYKS